MLRVKPWICLIAAVVLAGCSSSNRSASTSAGPLFPGFGPGPAVFHSDPSLAFDYTTIDGTKVSSSDLKGKVVVLDVFSPT